MTAPALVSIVICAWNNWPDLGVAVASALHQSWPNVEVIVVDNGSGDATPVEVPRLYGDRVRYVRQRNRGCAGAYNAGAALASGEFVQFLDGDDVLAPDKVERQVKVFEAQPRAMIVYGEVRHFQNGPGVARWNERTLGPVNDMLALLTAPRGPWIDTLSVLMRRSVPGELGGWDETLYVEDADFFLRAAARGCEFAYCDGSPLGFKRRRDSQKMNDVRAMEEGLDAIWHKALGYVSAEPYRTALRAKIADWRLRRAVFRRFGGRRVAWRDIGAARAFSPETVPGRAALAARAAVLLPGGDRLAQLPWMQCARRFIVPAT